MSQRSTSVRHGHPIPLRRLDHSALLRHLSLDKRPARLVWQRQRAPGSLSASIHSEQLVFLPSPEHELTLPDEGQAVVLLFRIRGLDFRTEGTVRRFADGGKRVMVEPDISTWSVKGVRLPDARYHREAVILDPCGPKGRRCHLHVLALTSERVLLVAWPLSKQTRSILAQEARLSSSSGVTAKVKLEVRNKAPVFPNCTGRILEATVDGDSSDLEQLIDTLMCHPDRRADAD